MQKLKWVPIAVAAGSLALLLFIAVALLLFVDADAYRPRLETGASQVLGMDVRISGHLGIGFFPGLHISLEDVHIGNQGIDIATVKEVRVRIDLLPLLKKQVRFGSIALEHPRIFIERDRDGNFNFEKPEPAGGTLPSLDLPKISLSEGTLRFMDQPSGEGFEALGCSLKVDHLRFARGRVRIS